MHVSCIMNHMAPIMNLPGWTLSVFSERLSHSQRAAGQGQQETNSCQANFTLNAWMTLQAQLRSGALGRDGTRSCSHLYNQIKLFLLWAQIENVLGRYSKSETGVFYDGEQPLEDTLLDSETGVINVTSLARIAIAASHCLLLKMSAFKDKRDESLVLT